MTGVLVWKELREQSMAAVALVVLGAGLLIGIHVWSEPSRAADLAGDTAAGIVLPLLLVWLCGLIAGAQPFAVECENGTMTWLDALPISRRRIWLGKTLGATAVLFLQVALIVGLAGWLSFLRSSDREPVAGLILLFALSGYAFGLFGSAAGRSPLAAIGWALLGQMIWAPVLMIVANLFPIPIRNAWPTDLFLIAMVPAVPAFVSYRLFTRLDRARRGTAISETIEPRPWRVLIWLAWRQVRWFHAVVLGVGLLIASVLPRTEPLAWPFFGVVLGVAMGVSAFGPDQLGGAVRFLGDRRLPLGRLWLVKTFLPLLSLGAIVLVILLNIALMFAVRNQTGPRDMAIDLLASSGMILLGPVYGFAVGQFFGLVCRKGAVASVLAILSAAGLLAVWLPSMIVGGLAIWQWLLPPLVLIAATRLAMRPWVAGRLSDWRPAIGIAGAGLLALGGVALSLWWRVIEAPAAGPPFDVAAFLASVPPPEKNEAGAKMRLASDQFGKHVDDKQLFARDPAANPRFTDGTYYSRALDASASDWPAADAGFNDWMDEVFSGEWFRTLRAAVALPPGIVSLPWPPTSSVSSYPQFAQIGALLRARGLQLQARGMQDESFAMFRLALDTSRHLRPRTCVWQYHTVTGIELNVLRTLPLWAAKVGDRPDLLRQALVMLREGESALPPLAETIETEYVTELQRPLINPDPKESRFSRELREMAHFTPWERERFDHIYNTMFAGWLRTANLSYRTSLTRAEALGRPTPPDALLLAWLPAENDPDGARQREKLRQLLSTEHDLQYVGLPDFVFSREPYTLTHWRATQLQIALLLYEKEHGRPAERLADLMPAILPAVPIDPFDGGAPFHYRVSQGERIAMQPGRGDDDGMVAVEPGQGVVWSVSTDLVHDGGVRNCNSLGFGRGPPGLDLIFLVPVAGRR
jgi:hypothetical protein